MWKIEVSLEERLRLKMGWIDSVDTENITQFYMRKTELPH